MGSPILAFLQSCEADGIKYVCWKGFHKIRPALEARADLDIHISEPDRPAFRRVARACGLLELIPSVIFRGIEHWYIPHPQSDRWFHLHIYFKIRTGVTFRKGHILDGDALIDARVLSQEGLYILPSQIAKQVHATRMYLRRQGVLGQLLYHREKEKHSLEARQLCYSEGSGLDLPILGFRCSEGQTVLHSFNNVSKRVLNKVLGRRKSLEKGMVVSIVGSDGTGKSTTQGVLCDFLSKEINVISTRFGQPKFYPITSIFWFFRKVVQRFRPHVAGVTKSKPPPVKIASTSFGASIYHLFLGLERYWVIRRAHKMAERGYLVVMDRCPTLTVGQMDGPKIQATYGIACWIGELERIIYKSMPKSTFAIRLTLPLTEMVARNRGRVKHDKETDDEIVERYELFQHYDPNAHSVGYVDAGDDLIGVLNSSVSLLVEQASSHPTGGHL